MFVVSDAAFDIHFIDQAGNEIPAEQALKVGAKHRSGAEHARQGRRDR